MATPIPMPARGDRNAPQFDSGKPRELPRYFSDLEFHFARAAVTDSTEKKQHATRFVSVADQDVWEALDEFKSAATYDEFKSAVLRLYPGTDIDRKFSLADLDSLVGEYARLGILSKGDYSEFYRQFLVITQYLIAKQRLSHAEQSRSFCRALAPARLRDRVDQRLQIKKPDDPAVFSNDPYDLKDLHEAVEFVLANTSNAPVATADSHPSHSTSMSSPSQSEVKQEPGISALLDTMNGLIKVLAAQQQQSISASSQSARPPPRTDLSCSYCSETGHFIIKCPHVDEDITAGKCKRDTDGRVVLPSGAFVPRRIDGRNLRARIEEWHRQNPGQLGAAQLLLDVPSKPLSTPSSGPASSPINTNTFQLSAEERIQSLEREIFAIRTRAQARRAAVTGEPAEQPEQPIRPTPAPTSDPTPAPPPAVPEILRRPNPAASSSSAAPTPEHPFSKARDAAYAPPRDRNVGARPNPASLKKPDPAYRTSAPVYDEKIAHDVFDRSMDAPITLTQRELLSLSPEVRAQVRDATTSRRVAPNPKEKSSNAAAAPVNHTAQTALPPDAFIVPDPFEVFFASGDAPDDLVVSLESSAIRSILPVVDNRQQVESIVDGVHVVRSPAYDILLGRPFDVLTESVVRNFSNENQTITICDPNTGKVATVPTVPRGPPRARPQNFHHSRN
ncbi:hypothetical protein B0H15DRAFT_769685 [Mycena belliarum]|uniref:DUF4100 domain-containing protein n=1 Tax=Mycena belliarum TaxID=1033014 RepID=A0AAD6ULX5_9AGAR|nr:hypothetical protein B0H15DRAFT_769685 [Mycena belliae]